MSNSLVDEYRKLIPNDPRSDDQLTLLFGEANQDGRYNNRPDFVKDYARLTQPQSGPDVQMPPPSVGEEFARGVSRGTTGMETSAIGLGALAAPPIPAIMAPTWALFSVTPGVTSS